MKIRIIVILFLVSTLHSLAQEVRGVVTTNVNVRWEPTTKSKIIKVADNSHFIFPEKPKFSLA